MKIPVYLLVSAIALAPVSVFANNVHLKHASDVDTDQGPVGMSYGTVKKVNRSLGKITIQHGPLKNLNMPAMTMVFKAKDPAMLDAVGIGDHIRFQAEHRDGNFTVVVLKPDS